MEEREDSKKRTKNRGARPPESIAPHSKLSFLKLPSFSPLINVHRSRCTTCDKYQRFVCYECMKFMHDDPLLPRLVLPIELHVFHHRSEARSKSTAVHAAIVAPSSTTFHEYPDLPHFPVQDTLLVYPHPDATTLSNVSSLDAYKRVVFVDSQWRKSEVMLRDPSLRNLKRICLNDYITSFWRHQNFGPTHLATIEAIYYFYREYALACNGKYSGEYDSLMYLFAFQYELIQNRYDGRAMPRMPHFVRESNQQETGQTNNNKST